MTAVESSVANWFETNLSSAVGASDLTFNVDSLGSLSSPALIVIDPRSATKREVIRADGMWGASSFVASNISRRGLDGSAGGAQAHDAGTKVVVAPLAQHIEDIHDRIDEHAAAADAHPDYLTAAEGNAAYEAKVSRTGATAGEVPTLQADNTLAFAAVAGGGVTSEGFRAHRSTTQALSAATYTKIVFNTEDRDEGADYDPVTGDWTVPATGWYDVAARVYFVGLSAGNVAVVELRVGGTLTDRLAFFTSGGADDAVGGGSLPRYLTAGNVVSVYAYRQTAGNVASGSHNTYFTAKRRY